MIDDDIDAALAAAAEQRPPRSRAELLEAAESEADSLRNVDLLGFEVSEKGARKPSLHNCRRALALLGPELRYNKLTAAVEADGRRAFEDDVDGLRLRADRLFRFTPPNDDWHRLVRQEALLHSYHPVCDYLDALSWDGVPRLDTWLVAYGGAAGTPYARAVGRLVLVAACRRVRQPGCKFDEMLVLEGPQGIGKSTALRILAARDEWFTDDIELGAESREMVEATRGRWIVECGELTGLGRADRARLKSYMSRQVDVARLAYRRDEEPRPRQFILLGSSNDREYLGDDTGERRFWPVAVLRFDLEALLRDRDLLWAEAAAAEATGESIRLAPELWPDAAAEQAARKVVDPYEILLAPLLGPERRIDGAIDVRDVWGLLGLSDPNHAAQRRATAVMAGLGWTRDRRRREGERVYCYVRGTDQRWWSAAEVRGLGNTMVKLGVV